MDLSILLTKIKKNCLFTASILAIFVVSFSFICNPFSPLVTKAEDKDSAQISLEIRVPGICILNIITHPEKRIPREGNWDTRLEIELYVRDFKVFPTLYAISDESGTATIDMCSLGYNPIPLTYDICIKGYSHLKKKFPNRAVFASDDFVTNLTGDQERELLAGETSNIFDNKINSLDASTQIRAFFEFNNEKNDLNQDSRVNSLDFSNTVYNFYQLGDDCN